MVELRRRQAVLGATNTVAVFLAGCVGSPDSDGSTESPNQNQDSITRDDITFDVSVEQGFTDTHTAQVQISLTNTLEMPAILSTGATPPFTSYLSGSQSDDNRLILIPDVSEDESPLAWTGETDPLPSNAENGCWNVTQEVLIEDIGAEIRLDQGETTSQEYAVYGYQNDLCPSSGAYQFEDTLRLIRGQPSADSPEHEVTLEFTVTLDEDQSLSVENDNPIITTTEE